MTTVNRDTPAAPAKNRSRLTVSHHEDLLFVVPVLGYILAGYLIIGVLVKGHFEFHLLYKFLYVFAAIFSLFFLILQFTRGRLRHYLKARVIIGFFAVLALFSPFASVFSSIKQNIPTIHYFEWDYFLMKMDYYLHGGNHPWRLFSPLLDYAAAIKFLDRLYMSWFLVLFCFCLWMAWSQRRLLRMKFFVCTSVVWMVFGSLLGTIFSSVGPCYYSKVVIDGNDPYQPLMSALSSLHEIQPLWAVNNQLGLWAAYSDSRWLPFGGISAMPSIHVAMVVLFALVGISVNRLFGAAMALYAFLVFVGSVILGWHYAVDGYISVVLTVTLWYSVDLFISRLQKNPRYNSFLS